MSRVYAQAGTPARHLTPKMRRPAVANGELTFSHGRKGPVTGVRTRAARFERPSPFLKGRVRRETGKRQTVEVRHGEGVANRTGPE
jgi:hypothetical protein